MRLLFATQRFLIMSGVAATLSCAALGNATVAWAIPGESAESTIRWIQGNAFIQPKPTDSLLVQRGKPDGSRFTFQASVVPPGRIVTPLDKETIRSERMTFFEPNGISADFLGQAIREVYGPEIAADFDQATEVIRYPSAEILNAPATAENYLQRAIQGVVREGKQLVYWLELTQNPDGRVQQGQVVVFQPEFLPKVQSELAARYALPSP